MELDEYKCKFCDNMIIAGYRCVDCYINKIDKIPTKPYMDEDFMKGYEDKDQPKQGFPFIPNPLTDEARLRGFRYDPFTTGTGDLPVQFETHTDTTTGAGTYNPWFKNTWHRQYAPLESTSSGTVVDYSSGTNSQDF